MIGDGEVWIAEVRRDRECRSRYVIRAINV